MKTLTRTIPAAAVLLGLLATAHAADTTVEIQNFTFVPASITVVAGTKVTFRNADDIPHSVVAADGSFRSPALDTDDTFSFTFTKAGTYEFSCGLHPFMRGKIIVGP